MSTLHDRLKALSPADLKGMRRGIEKESLRANPDGSLALTPHPAALGSALTHPHITTDFSESQIELVTGVHGSAEACLAELTLIHQGVLRAIGDEVLWVGSMPCGLPVAEAIPIGRYGWSNVGRSKSVYRMGLGHRYGRRMQTISGIHYNWSMPGVTTERYFDLIRNFRRHAFLLLYLFGASPALCSSFVADRKHELQVLRHNTLYMPHGSSLRMGRLGYQSDAQGTLAVSYNSLESYSGSLQDALTRPYPAYERLGVMNPGGDYNQLATSLLQIENEFYGTIRPKRVTRPGERPLHALRERGVEYVEVRCMDLDPFEPIGIAAPTLRFLDIFLLHCLLADSPADTPEEIAALARNQHRVAARGREPGVRLERDGVEIGLAEWGRQVLDACAPIAAALDAGSSAGLHQSTLADAQAALDNPDALPSARVLASMRDEHDNSYVRFARAQSDATRRSLLALPLDRDAQATMDALARASMAEQKRIEASDRLPFDRYLSDYLAPDNLFPNAHR